jgi:MFS transporter, AAHS family, 4-hydroxybenzoate transporter
VIVVFIAGIFMNTSQASMPALAAGFYPTEGRATGVAWMLGIAVLVGLPDLF